MTDLSKLIRSESHYQTVNWNSDSREVIDLRAGDALIDLGRPRVTISRFYQQDRYGWMCVFTNGNETEMDWIAPRLGADIVKA